MIIDVHAHWGPWFFSMDVGSIDVNIELLDRFGIDIQLVSAIEAIVYDAPTGNRALASQLPADPRLRGMLVVDPRRLDEARTDLTELLAGDGRSRWVGAKIHTEYSRTPIDSPAMQAAIELTTEFGLPTLVLVPEAADRSDRIWFEPCWSAPEANRIRWILDQIGPSRLMFGTDATLIDPSVALGAFEAANLTPTEHEAVMWRNAQQLFNL